MISRRSVQTVFGLIWFLDGLFQLKPQMFTTAFIKQVILPTAQGQPAWISGLVQAGGNLVSGHIAVWNIAFAAVQILLGLALMFNVGVKATVVLSITWSVIVWSLGEGFGQLLTGQTLLLNGAPGAAAVYGLISGAIWPAQGEDRSEWNARAVRFAQISLACLFVLGGLLHLQPAYLGPDGLSQAVSVSWLAKALAHHGMFLSLTLALVEFVLALLLIFRVQMQFAVLLAIVLNAVFWWVGQSLGQITDPLATDFNTGLLMIVLAVCAYPQLLGKQRETTATRNHVLA